MFSLNYKLKAKTISKISKDHTVVIYGAGGATIGVLNEMETEVKKKILAVIDGSPAKQGTQIHGIEIHDLTKISELNPNYIIINVQDMDTSKAIRQFLTMFRDTAKVIDLNEVYPIYSYRTSIEAVIDWTAFKKRLPLIVFQMAKVGSTTVLASLENYDPSQPVWHVHDLKERLDQLKSKVSSDEKLSKQLIGCLPDSNDERLKVISLVRDPISKNISTFFQDKNTLNFDFGHQSTSSLIDDFFNSFDHETPLNWFDDEMKTVFGIDVFERNFPKKQGYQIIKGEEVELLVLRLEDLNDCAESAFNEFLGIQDFQLLDSNIGESKRYRQVYLDFKESIEIPGDYVKKMYDSKYARHFYSDEEIKSFKKKWLKRHQNRPY